MTQVLDYEVVTRLDVSALMFDEDGYAIVIGQGCRYGGEWVITLLAFTPQSEPVNYDTIGEIETGQGDSEAGFATMQAWMQSECLLAGLRLASAEDVNNQRPAEERPFFLAGRFVVAR